MSEDRYHDSWSKLIEFVGRPEYLNAQYGITATYAYSRDIVHTFEKMQYVGVKQSKFDTKIILEQLQNGNLILCTGDSDAGAHEWIIDGSRQVYSYIPSVPDSQILTTFFHCVWGWGGTSNGLFLYESTIGGNAWEYDEGTNASTHKFTMYDITYGFKPDGKKEPANN